MKKIAEGVWQVGTCTLRRVVSVGSHTVTWYVIDCLGGMAGFTTRKAALHACESRNYWASKGF